MRSRLTYLIYSLVAGALLAGIAWVVLISPDNPLVSPFRAKIENADSKVIVGPYPLINDFPVLERLGVTTIVTLLDPRLPHEQTLLEKERRNAAAYGMTVMNFPLTNVMGRKVRADYEKTATAAAEAVRKAEGKVYLHCYLGLHRVKSVRDIVEAQGTVAGNYATGRSKRPGHNVEQAEVDFHSGKYGQTIERLKGEKRVSPSVKILEGWSNYRLRKYDQAAEAFAEVLQTNPQIVEAKGGLGYCALQQGRLDEASGHFETVLERSPADPAALVGLGLVRRRQGRLQEAVDLLRLGLKADPTNEEAASILESIKATGAGGF